MTPDLGRQSCQTMQSAECIGISQLCDQAAIMNGEDDLGAKDLAEDGASSSKVRKLL